MDPALASREVARWEADGQLARPQILQRLDDAIRASSALSGPEATALDANLFAAAESEHYDRRVLTRPAWARLLRAKAGEGVKVDDDQAATLFDMLAYLAAVPFPPPSGATAAAADEHGGSLSRADLARALTWLLPGRASRPLPRERFGRGRTRADERRLLFQSLAVVDVPSSSSSSEEEEAWRARARRGAQEVRRGGMPPPPPSSSKQKEGGEEEVPTTNRDDDGDELFHDVLDVLFATQPRLSPSLAPVRRDALRPAARDVVGATPTTTEEEGGPLPRLRDLAVPRRRLLRLLELVQVLGGTGTGAVGALEVETAVVNAAQLFCCLEGGREIIDGSVRWPQFDDVLSSEPRLFKPLYDLFKRVLLK
ncbi:hypothetical protein GGR56DRAFT_697810 [Xylariaceae sp. FL0804]|nr:hypothetical protein GGR56DRAFT_697810 [Xylariaceae sp. FL0804]